jgi:hypothetical protein
MRSSVSESAEGRTGAYETRQNSATISTHDLVGLNQSHRLT